MEQSPKVFISYSHDDEAHKQWVLKLASHLRTELAVDVILDQWDLRVGSDLSLYMEQGISGANLVVCICSANYVRKANEGVCGTGYEKMILTKSLLNNTNTDFIIPIVRNNPDKTTPVFLGTKLYLDFSDDDYYFEKLKELAQRIYNEDIAQKPKLGSLSFGCEELKALEMKNAIEATKYHNPYFEGEVVFDYSNNSSTYTIGNGEYQFDTRWSSCSMNSIYAYRDNVKYIGYISNFCDFPTAEQLNSFDYTSRVRTISVGEVVVWVNEYGNYAVTKIKKLQVKSRGAEADLLEFEYKIYPNINIGKQ